MSKVDIRTLDSLSHNDSAATKLINDNFNALKKGIEDSVSRTGKTPNFMDAEFDMNNRRVINLGEPINDSDAVSYGTYKKHIDKAIQAAEDSENSVKKAASSAAESKQYAINSRNAMTLSKQYRDEAIKAVTDGQADINSAVSEGLMHISDTVEAGKETLENTTAAGEEILKKYPLTTFFNPFVLHDVVFDTNDWIASTTYAEEGYNFVKTVTYNTLLPMPSGNQWASAAFVTLNMKEAVSGNIGPYATAFLTDHEGMAILGISLYAKTAPTEQFSIASISWFIKEKPNGTN